MIFFNRTNFKKSFLAEKKTFGGKEQLAETYKNKYTGQK
jgi:hypothetical protein